MQIFSFVASKEDESLNAKSALKKHFSMSSRYMRKVSRIGTLSINGQIARLWFPLKEGDQLSLRMPCESKANGLHFPADQQPLYRSDNVFVLSKKVGQVVHPCLNKKLEDLCTLISSEPLHPVLRLDRDTSGLVLFALHGYAHHILSLSPIQKKYYGLVHGVPSTQEGFIEQPIARSLSSIVERWVDPQGKYAKTGFTVLSTNREQTISLLEFELFTGRTHQIRVHASFSGHPLIGDSMYGYNTPLDREMGRQALHASFLSFDEPLKKERVCLRDPLPQDFLDFMIQQGLDLPTYPNLL